MSSRQPTQSDPHPLPRSGLSKELEKLGRTRGSSATTFSQSSSPTLYRGHQSRTEIMASSDSLYNGSPSTDRDISGKPRRTHRRYNESISRESTPSVCGDSEAYSSSCDEGHNGGGSRQRTTHCDASENLTPSIMSVNQLVAHMAKRLNDVVEIIIAHEEIPQLVTDQLVIDLRAIVKDFLEQQFRLQRDFQRARQDRIQIGRSLDVQGEELREATSERDRLSAEADDLRRDVADLEAKLANREEQLQAIRRSGRDSSMGSIVRRENSFTGASDPFQSPLAHINARSSTGGSQKGSKSNKQSRLTRKSGMSSLTHSGSMGSFSVSNLSLGASSASTDIPLWHASPSMMDTSTCTPSERRRLRARRLSRYNPVPPSSPEAEKEIPDPRFPRRHPPNMNPDSSPTSSGFGDHEDLILSRTDENDGYDLKCRFGKFLVQVEGWAKLYASQPNSENELKIAKSNPNLWTFMLNCMRPGYPQESSVQVLALLQNFETRAWFVMRMALTYCFKDIMTIEALYFDADTKIILEDCKEKLKKRGLVNEVRQEIIDKRARAVLAYVGSSQYPAYRNNMLIFHTKRLRDLLGPLLNNDCSRSFAGKDLGAMAVYAFDTSVEIFSSYMTFQIVFPEIQAKFNYSTMEVRNKPADDPIRLQSEQTRLQLVMSPVITMRDDRGATIRAKNHHKAMVLCSP